MPFFFSSGAALAIAAALLPPSFSPSRMTSLTLSGADRLQARRAKRRRIPDDRCLHDSLDRLDALANQERRAVHEIGEANHAALDDTERHLLLALGDGRLANAIVRKPDPLNAGHDAIGVLSLRNDRWVARPALVLQRGHKPQVLGLRNGEAAPGEVGFDYGPTEPFAALPGGLCSFEGAHRSRLGRMAMRSSETTTSRKLQPAWQ